MTDTKTPAARIGLVIGLAVLAFGVVGLLGATSASSVQTIVKWVIAADLINDLAIAPAVCVAGLLLARYVPARWRAPIRSAAIASGCVLVVAYPLLRAFGRHHVPDNQSVLPLDYPAAVATLLGVIWVVAIIWAGVLWWRSRSDRVPPLRVADHGTAEVLGSRDPGHS
jgi:hypothetical protein